MAASSRGARAGLGLLRPATTASHKTCSGCLARPSTLRWASTTPSEPLSAPSLPPSATTPTAGAPAPTATPAATPPPYAIRAGIMLMRAPLLTRRLTPFEESFYFYQKRLNERLTMAFVSDVYFKHNTPARMDWLMKLRERRGVLSRELGDYNGRRANAWDDELRVGDPLSSQDNAAQRLAEAAVMRVSEDAEIIPVDERAAPERPLDRTTDADRAGDVTKLDRALDRTLYLVVKDGQGKWVFPTRDVGEKEGLHHTAKNVLDETAGINMNTWMVGRVPVAHLCERSAADKTQVDAKTFFLKGRIMAGQANLAGNKLGYTEFRWLTREELEKALEPEYFAAVEKAMPAR